MSAFVVSDNHIHAIIRFAATTFQTVYTRTDKIDLRVPEECDRLGQTLLAANYASVNYRYQDSPPAEPHEYRYVRPDRLLSPVEMVKALRCMDYQSCEVPDWRDTEAHGIIYMLLVMTLQRLPGFDEAPWDIK